MRKYTSVHSYRAVTSMKEPWVLQAIQLIHSALILFDTSKAAYHKMKSEKRPKGPHMYGSDENILVNDYNSIDQSIFLMGLAIENLLKGLWIQKERKLGSLKAKDKMHAELKNQKNGHSLLNLARLIEFPISINEQDILNNFTEYILWKGRYPIPTELNQFSNSKSLHLKLLFLESKSDELPPEIDNILLKLFLLYKN